MWLKIARNSPGPSNSLDLPHIFARTRRRKHFPSPWEQLSALHHCSLSQSPGVPSWKEKTKKNSQPLQLLLMLRLPNFTEQVGENGCNRTSLKEKNLRQRTSWKKRNKNKQQTKQTNTLRPLWVVALTSRGMSGQTAAGKCDLGRNEKETEINESRMFNPHGLMFDLLFWHCQSSGWFQDFPKLLVKRKIL